MKTIRDALLEIREELMDSKIVNGQVSQSPPPTDTRPVMNIYKNVKPKRFEEFYKFQLYVNEENSREHSVGVAYMREGLSYYTLKLWTFLDQRFYLFPLRDDPTKYRVMSKDVNRTSNPKNKFFWNQIGIARSDSKQRVLEIQFDLFPRKIFMNLFPDQPSTSHRK